MAGAFPKRGSLLAAALPYCVLFFVVRQLGLLRHLHDDCDIEMIAKSRPSAFDAAVQRAMDKMSAQFEGTDGSTRKPFHLETWGRKTTGGLFDSDRMKLAEIYEKAESVFEWGLGESTYIAAAVGVPRYGGTDSDAVWIRSARENSPDHFRFHLGDIGPTGSWGRPERNRLPKSYLNYQFAPLLSENKAFDVYMVDGRMRPACALVAFLHASSRGETEKEKSPLVLVHDYYDEDKSLGCDKCRKFRWQLPFHRLLEVADLVDHSGAMLAIFKRKVDISDEEIRALWEEVGMIDS